MADYWKSQPKKFCQYCKCWIADNKPSVEFHERGKNHKENVAAKIAEIKKKSVDKLKQEERMSKEFAAMEAAAMKAYEEDMKRMGIESGSQAQTTAKAQPQPQPQPQRQPQRQPQPPPQRQKKNKKQMKKESRKPAESNAWVEGKTEDGHTYYYNSLSGESRWEKPEGFQGESSDSAQLGQKERPAGDAWVEAVSPDGYTYYYNSETGESSWERPAGLPSIEPPPPGSASGSGREGAGQEEPPTPPQELLSGGEESSNGAGGNEQASQEPKVPKISFRKREAETEPSGKEGEDKGGDGGDGEEDRGEKKGEEEARGPTAAPEEKKEEEKPKAKRSRAFNPYGTWEQIQEEEDPYAKVDLQLPQVEVVAPDEPPPEPRPKFRERTITSLGDEGGPASFRKTKTQNGKARSLRQRGKDD